MHIYSHPHESIGNYSEREQTHLKQKAYNKVELTPNIFLINIKVIDIVLKKNDIAENAKLFKNKTKLLNRMKKKIQ